MSLDNATNDSYVITDVSGGRISAFVLFISPLRLKTKVVSNQFPYEINERRVNGVLMAVRKRKTYINRLIILCFFILNLNGRRYDLEYKIKCIYVYNSNEIMITMASISVMSHHI